MRFFVVLGVLAGSLGALGLAPRARACGGGLVTTTEVAASAGDAQRIVVSIYGGVTQVITQIGVPKTSSDYGALLPVPSQPTLDPEPVPSHELDQLDALTEPTLLVTEGDDGGGFSCGCIGGVGAVGADAKSAGGSAVKVGGPVTIGPVTAVVLPGSDAAAVSAWLGENGFAIPEEHSALVTEYSGPGRYFIAIRRSETATTGGPTSIGVHFTLPMEHGELPLRFARLGAASKVTFKVFIAADRVIVPAAPFTTRNLNELEGDIIRMLGYRAAIEEASTRDGIPSFVIERGGALSQAGGVGPGLARLLAPWSGRQLTRLTTILPASTLSADAHFTDTYTREVPTERRIGFMNPVTTSTAIGWLTLLFRLRKRRARRTSRY